MKNFKSVFAIGLAVTLSLSLLMGCGSDTKKESTQADATAVEKAKDSTTAGTDEKVILRIVDWSDSTKAAREKFHQEFMERHPNVEIEYTLLTMDQFSNTVLTAIKAGNGPDIFPVPNGMQLSVGVSENWFKPLSDYVTEEFLATINPGAMLEGYQKVNDTLYVLPENIGLPSSFVYYNKDILLEAGLDPENPPKTWEEFREANKKITESGSGKYYGFIEGGNQLGRWEALARGWAGVAGGYAGRANTAVIKNGRSIYDTPEMIDVFNLLKDIATDGSFHPDTVNISAPEARAMFAQGQAGFLVQGIWCVAGWQKENPELNFGVMPIPTPDKTVKGSVAAEIPLAWAGISSSSKIPDIAGQYMMELYSEGYQGDCVAGGGFISIVDEFNDKYMPEGATQNYYKVAMEQSRIAPDPLSIEPKVSEFYVEVKDIQPSLSAILQGVVAGSIDPETYLKELSDKSTAEWTRAAQAVGIDVSLFEFANWNVTEDYTQEMYKELK